MDTRITGGDTTKFRKLFKPTRKGTTMAEQNVMSKIMKLLERANHPGTPLVEAQSCADKAEQLMAQHQIDRMDLKPEDRSKVVKDEWILNVGGMEGNFRYHLVVLLETITKHCKIRMNHTSKSVKDENGNVDYSRRAYVLVGFPEDLSYAEQIWFRVFKEFVTSINPQWDGSKSLGENCYAMLSAGFKWGEIWGMAYRLQPTDGYAMRSGRNIMIADPATTKYNSSLKKAVKEYMEDAGIGEYTSHTQRHNVYRNNFAQSFSDTIGSRLRDQRKKAEEVVSDSDKYALALRTTEEQVDEEFYRLFPEYDPDVQRKKREA
jgi:hypothetical protein